MGQALEVVTGYVTTASLAAGTYSAFTANSGQSYSIRQANGVPAAHLLAPWAQAGAAGWAQIKSPRMHDTTIGTTFLTRINTDSFGVDPLAELDYCEDAYATDVLTVQYTPLVSITASKTITLGLPVYYDDLPGVAANLTTWQAVQAASNSAQKTGDHYVSWVVPSSAATAGQIGTGVAINSTNDQFKANHSYALLGYSVSAQCAAVLIQGVDTGNLYVGGPGTLDLPTTRFWFRDLAVRSGRPCIPVIQANNKGATFITLVDGQTTATAFDVQLTWVDLGILNTPVGA